MQQNFLLVSRNGMIVETMKKTVGEIVTPHSTNVEPFGLGYQTRSLVDLHVVCNDKTQKVDIGTDAHPLCVYFRCNC
jgi:hypothetical protein